jgi:hypothetical protein
MPVSQLRWVTFVAFGIAAGLGALSAQTVNRWIFTMVGNPGVYENGISRPDPDTSHNGLPSVYVRSRIATPDDEGAFGQTVPGDSYRGKRVRFHAFVKVENVSSWAGLWMRIIQDAASFSASSVDDMKDRPLQGTKDWQQYDVVLDAMPNTALIAYGIRLHGSGTVWLGGDTKLEIVSQQVPTTGRLQFTIPR